MTYPGPDLPPNPTKAQRAAHEAAFAKWVAEDRARIAGQRKAMLRVPSRQRRALVALMLGRAWELLDCGECEAADALLEFCPEPDATKLLDEFFPE